MDLLTNGHKTSTFLLLAIFFFLSWVRLIEHLNSAGPKFSTNFTFGTMKTILLWSDPKLYPFDLLETGSSVFRKYNCPSQNCYVTSKRDYFGDITKFDAIAFNGRHLKANDIPQTRLHYQNYIYFNTESADNYPACSDVFDNFFNITATYRLDSDLPFNYFDIQDKKGHVVGPKIEMSWTAPSNIDVLKLNKTKAVAWFVSNCNARSSRKQFAKNLQRALSPFGYTVDIFGTCGNKKCPKSKENVCYTMLGKDYYFYFSAENSFSEDYVTEKVLVAMQNNVVPIVYGGADYYRFLPPHSFIDSRAFTPTELASLIAKLIKSPQDYLSYFGWKKHYSYVSANLGEEICAICETLNIKPRTQIVYERFRKWWNPNFEERCR